MPWDDSLRLVVIIGYTAVAVQAAIAIAVMDDLLRRLIAAGLLLVSVTWLTFYVLVVPASVPTTPPELQAAVIYSRIAHFPMVGLGLAVAAMVRERDEVRREQVQIARQELDKWEMQRHG